LKGLVRLAKDSIPLCSGTMLHEVVVIPRTLNMEIHLAARFLIDLLEITQMLPQIHAYVISFWERLMGALEK